jgi:hypothetical protein
MRGMPRLSIRRIDSGVTGSTLLQTLVTVVVAVVVALAAIEAGAAAGEWQASSRREIKRDAAALEDIRYVYLDEAPAGLEVALAEARSAVRGDAEGATQQTVAGTLRHGGLFEGGRYRLAEGGFDVARRLGDVRRGRGELVRIDPDAAVAAGDRRRRTAMAIVLLVIPLVLSFLVVDFVMRRRQRRRAGPPAAEEEAAAQGPLPRRWSAPRPGPLGLSVALVAWLVVTLLPVLQVHFGNQAQRAGALSTRRAVEVSTEVGGGTTFTSFRGNSVKRVTRLATEGPARRLVALDTQDPATKDELLAEARADDAASRRGLSIVESMAREPDAASGVDSATREILTAGTAKATATAAEQRRESTRAEHAGLRSGRVSLALLFGGLALSLSGLAARDRGGRRNAVHGVAAVLLAAALLAAVSVAFL